MSWPSRGWADADELGPAAPSTIPGSISKFGDIGYAAGDLPRHAGADRARDNGEHELEMMRWEVNASPIELGWIWKVLVTCIHRISGVPGIRPRCAASPRAKGAPCTAFFERFVMRRFWFRISPM